MNIEEARAQAELFRNRYISGELTRGEAENGIKPYQKLFNERSAELAAKYNQKPKRFSMSEFLRYNG